MRKTGKILLDSLKTSSDVVTLPINRLSIISDFIFASAMTMMVLFLNFPDPDQIKTSHDLIQYYIDNGSGSGIINFLSTFLIVGVYWLKHLERFKHYKATSEAHIYIEIFFLAFLVLVPIANSLTVLFPSMFLIHGFYSLVMFCMGMLAHFSWKYATKYKLIHSNVSPETIIGIKHESLVEPMVAVIAALLTIINPMLWDISLFMIPFFFILQRAITKRKINKNQHNIQHHA